jgi:hypothetical protein
MKIPNVVELLPMTPRGGRMRGILDVPMSSFIELKREIEGIVYV